MLPNSEWATNTKLSSGTMLGKSVRSPKWDFFTHMTQIDQFKTIWMSPMKLSKKCFQDRGQKVEKLFQFNGLKSPEFFCLTFTMFNLKCFRKFYLKSLIVRALLILKSFFIYIWICVAEVRHSILYYEWQSLDKKTNEKTYQN